MNVVITGGAGFLGSRLARELLKRGTLSDASGRQKTINRLTLLDMNPVNDRYDSRVRVVTGDLADSNVLASAIGSDTHSVFHLAAIVSSHAEADFGLGMRINIDASRLLLDACRVLPHPARLVFTSSVAVYGGDLPDTVTDSTVLNPQSSYGVQKAIVDLLVNEYSRKGFIDGRVLRLPTISVRPGNANKAASSFASGIIREPLAGHDFVCPVAPETRIWLLSPRKAIESLIVGHELSSDALGLSRTINLPGISVKISEMVAALQRSHGTDVAKRIRWEYNPAVEAIVSSWPAQWDTLRAEHLGFTGDQDIDSIIRAYVEDELQTACLS